MVWLERREFITLLGSATAAWPLVARAQQQPMPVIGFLRSTPATAFAYTVDPFRQSLNDAGFVEGKNVGIEYRWADNQQIGYRDWRPISCAGKSRRS
jgi:putative tryptophan/tyrosine transport system substrate-binding protein